MNYGYFVFFFIQNETERNREFILIKSELSEIVIQEHL